MGFIADEVYFKISRENDTRIESRRTTISKIYIKMQKKKENKIISLALYSQLAVVIIKNSFFCTLFSFITLSAFLSHIAYDVFVDDKAKFLLLAPFSFSEFIIPKSYSLPIELVGSLLALVVYLYYRVKTHRKPQLTLRLCK